MGCLVMVFGKEDERCESLLSCSLGAASGRIPDKRPHPHDSPPCVHCINSHPSATLLRPLTQKISPAQTMANIAGYAIIRNAVRSELALKAVEIVLGNLAVIRCSH